ncbi:MAG: flagellar hook-length control protein FliK, partial [Lachnospiraceae bacterium]|nr:flagellar hook-length control protein FliK [Lachnospiraceae bacterium]
PVKDMGTLMNFVGTKNLTKTGSKNQMGSFGDLMDKAKGGAFAQNKPAANIETGKTPAADALQNRKETVKLDESSTQPVKAEEITQVTDEQSQEVTKAGEEIIKEIAEEFGITEEEVENAMEQLGISIFGLFDPSSLKELVLLIGGEQDASALLTNEGLFTNLQNIIAKMGEIQSGLAEQLGMSQEELAGLVEQLQSLPEQTVDVETELNPVDKGSFADVLAQETEIQEQPKITVEIKSGDETVKLATDENGNAVKTLEVTSSATEENIVKEDTGRQEQKTGEEGKGHSENAFSTGGQLFEGLVQNKTQNVEMPIEQQPAFFNEQTQEIVDQIVNYMKIQLRPGMSQLEMQLHPESLGTVHIQLVSRGGEVTAQFHVQNEAVKAAVESQVNTLVENLREQGVKVEAVQVSVESHGFESNLWQGQGKEDETSSQNGRKTPRRINLNDLNTLLEDEADEEEVLAAKMMEVNGNTVDYTV